ncbi:MAG: alpha/beta hydrolase [Chloroflexi bacterium]|nr:alpha/beta hydrolase [Chloroflexota bacterium]
MGGSGNVVISGIRVRQEIVGEGPPILMVHGWGASIELLAPLSLRLSQLGYRCLQIDLPGFGGSDEPNEPFTIFDYAAFCLACLDHLGINKVHYFGHSLGGRIGLILGSDHGDRIESLVLSNSAGIKIEAALRTRLRLSAYKSLRQSLENIGAKSAADSLRESYNRRFGSDDYRTASPILRQTLINVVNQDLLDHAKRVSLPTILIWGDHDQETPLWMGRKLEAAIPDAALIIHEGAGHYAYLDFSDRTASIMDALYRSA